MLPDLGYSMWFTRNREKDEIFWKTSAEIRKVVCQGIPATILVKLPGLFTNIGICFPIPNFVRVYVDAASVNKSGFIQHNSYFIGEFGDGHKIYHLPKRVTYKYGVELCPFMYWGKLGSEMKDVKSRIVNFIIENCCSGFAGIQLRFRDESDDKERHKEWFEVIWFDAGNDYWFFKEKHTKVLRLIPAGRIDNQTYWESKEGWNQFKRIRIFPAKTS